MDDAQRKEIEELIAGMKCPKEFICYTSGLEVLCKAKVDRSRELLECLDESPEACPFSVASGNGYSCCCPVRKYIVITLNK